MLKDKILEYLGKQVINLSSMYVDAWLNTAAQDIADIAEREYEKKFFEFVKVTDRYEKENIELKQVIAHSDGVQLQNEDLIRENDRLKKQLDISKDRIIKLVEDILFKQHWIKNNKQNKLTQYFTCKGILRDCAEQIANEILSVPKSQIPIVINKDIKPECEIFKRTEIIKPDNELLERK